MNRNVIRLSISDFTLSSSNLGLAMLNLCLRRSNLGVEFRNFKYGNYLAFLDPVADVDVDASDIPRNLSVKVDLLIRLEFTRDGQGTRQVTSRYKRDRCRGDRRIFLFVVSAPGQKDTGKHRPTSS